VTNLIRGRSLRKKINNIDASLQLGINRFLLLSLFFGALLSLYSCTHNNDTQQGEVIERSRATAPDWVKQNVNEVRRGEAGYRFSILRSQVLNLPLGVSQSQSAAKQLAEQAYVEMLQSSIERRASNSGISLDSKNQLTALILSAVSELFPDSVRVEDIYYERVRQGGVSHSNGSSFYQVHVLVTWPQLLDELTIDRLKALIAASDLDDIKKLESIL